jgi:two-component system sensor histidine kinase YesM
MLDYFISKYKNMMIRSKITAVYIPLIIMPLFIVIYTSNNIFTQSVIEKTKKNIADESNLIVMRIDGMISNAETCASMLTKDINKIYIDSEINHEDPVSFVSPINKIMGAISYDARAFKEIDSAAFIDIYSNIVTPDVKMVKYNGDILESELVKAINRSGPPEDIWFPMQLRDYFVTDKNSPVITIGKRIVDYDEGKTIGFLILNIREDAISSIFPKVGPDGSTGYFILDQDGKVVSSKNKQDLLKILENQELIQWAREGGKSAIELNLDNQSYLLTSTPIGRLGWKLINQIPVSDLTRETHTNSLISVIIGVICVIMAFLSAFFLSRLIASPVIKLTKAAKVVKEGELNVRCEVSSSDEIGILASVFNEMIVKIKELLSEVKLEQKKKREYELALIQSQIKPHFLYNSLDLIYVLCEMGNTAEASETTKALADYYRISLSKGREIISIKDEMSNVKDYLFIQKARYSDILDFGFEVSNDILECATLKMTLQPLVENSIYHGLKPKDRPGKIVIKAYAEGDSVVFKVMDDGVGMPKDQFKEILNSSDSPISKDSFGLKSVNERIKLHFGDEFGIEVDSEPGKGTVVTVVIPKKFGGA